LRLVDTKVNNNKTNQQHTREHQASFQGVYICERLLLHNALDR